MGVVKSKKSHEMAELERKLFVGGLKKQRKKD
jgi:hypothetical protein